MTGSVAGNWKDREHFEMSIPENIRALLGPFVRRTVYMLACHAVARHINDAAKFICLWHPGNFKGIIPNISKIYTIYNDYHPESPLAR